MSENWFFGGREKDLLVLKIIYLSPKDKLSGANKAYIDIGKGQEFQLLKCGFLKN